MYINRVVIVIMITTIIVSGYLLQKSEATNGLKLLAVFKEAITKSETMIDQRERLKQAEEHYSQAFSLMLPNISGSFNYFDLDTNSISSTGSGSTVTSNQFTSKLSLAMPLFRGGRDYAVLAQTKDLATAQANIFDSSALQLFDDTSQAFYAILSLEKDKAILEKEAALYEKRIAELKQRVIIGRSRQTEVLTMQVSLASLKAQIEQVKSQIAVAREQFSLITGLPAGQNLEDDFEIPSSFEMIENYVSKIKQRPDIKAAELNYHAASQNINIAYGAFLPSADLSGNYYLNRPAGTLQNSLWDATVLISLPIFSGAYNFSKAEEARSLERQSKNSLELAIRQAEESVRSVYQQLQYDLSQQKEYTSARKLAEKNLEAVSSDYSSGLVTNLDVIQAMTSYQDISRALNKMEYGFKADYCHLLALSAMVEIPEGNSK